MALRADGTVVAWGITNSPKNNLPSGLTNVVAIADGLDHCLAIVAYQPPLRLASPHLRNGVFTVSVPSQAGKSYVLQYKSGLSDGAWASLPAVAGTGSMLTLTDSTAAVGQRFYRVGEQ